MQTNKENINDNDNENVKETKDQKTIEHLINEYEKCMNQDASSLLSGSYAQQLSECRIYIDKIIDVKQCQKQ